MKTILKKTNSNGLNYYKNVKKHHNKLEITNWKFMI